MKCGNKKLRDLFKKETGKNAIQYETGESGYDKTIYTYRYDDEYIEWLENKVKESKE